jgi:hypothetical protein
VLCFEAFAPKERPPLFVGNSISATEQKTLLKLTWPGAYWAHLSRAGTDAGGWDETPARTTLSTAAQMEGRFRECGARLGHHQKK